MKTIFLVIAFFAVVMFGCMDAKPSFNLPGAKPPINPHIGTTPASKTVADLEAELLAAHDRIAQSERELSDAKEGAKAIKKQLDAARIERVARDLRIGQYSLLVLGLLSIAAIWWLPGLWKKLAKVAAGYFVMIPVLGAVARVLPYWRGIELATAGIIVSGLTLYLVFHVKNHFANEIQSKLKQVEAGASKAFEGIKSIPNDIEKDLKK